MKNLNNKDQKYRHELKVVYQWMRLVEKENKDQYKYKSNATMYESELKKFFELLQIPYNDTIIKVMKKSLNPKDTKQNMSLNDLIQYFAPNQEEKKKKNKLLEESLKNIGQQKQEIELKNLQNLIHKYYPQDKGLFEQINKQLSNFTNDKGNLNLKNYMSNLFYK